jgi:putative hydrolase of the HAD superfamily
MASIKYRHIFIDLDKTLWDFETNAMDTFRDIFDKYQLKERGIEDLKSFLLTYTSINDMLWGLYRDNQIKKEVLNIKRFEMTLNEFGIDDLILSTHIAEDYITISPSKTHLFPEVHESLGYLKKCCFLHIITNGFEEVQHKKLDNSDLRKYFTTITTSEEAGVKKPEKGIFLYALELAGADPGESLMIGDDIRVDIEGARNAGMDQMLFNPDSSNGSDDQVSYVVKTWKEVPEILGCLKK